MVDKTDNPENMKEFDTNESNNNIEKKEIVNEIVNILKPEINKKLQSIQSGISSDIDKKLSTIKNDIITDVKEVLDKINTSKPNVDSSSKSSSPIPPPSSSQQPFDIIGMLKKFSGKDGSVSASDISSLISGAQQQIQNPMADKDGTPLDVSKLSEGQLKYLSTQQNHQLMVQLLPSLIQMFQGNGGGDSMLDKMANNMLMKNLQSANISSDLYNKHLNKMMFKENMKNNSNEKQTRKTNNRKNNDSFVNRQ